MAEEGKKRVLDLFELEPTAVLDFFQIFPDEVNEPDLSVNFHGGTNGVYSPIIWQGASYLPVPIEVEGFAAKGDGSLPRPKIRIANLDYIVSQYMKSFDGMSGAKVVRKKVFAKYIDDENFEYGSNPFEGGANANMGFPDEVFFINRKTSETKSFVEFELMSSIELENVTIPRRIVLASFCPFAYRGDCCGFRNEKNLFNEKNEPLFGVTIRGEWSKDVSYFSQDIVYRKTKTKVNIQPDDLLSDESANAFFSDQDYAKVYFVSKSNDNIGNDPLKREDFWSRDECGKYISSCQKRFGTQLRFGGFPGTYGFGS